MSIKLRNGQTEAVLKLKNGNILCGGVGSGKSICSLAYYYLKYGGDIDSLHGKRYKKMKKPADLYIITLAKKRDDMEWDTELRRFLLNRDPDVNAYSNKVVVDSWQNIKKYKDVHDSFFIFDEQKISGSGTWSKIFIEISKHNQWILLSATPGDNWKDYATIFVANGFYRSKNDYANQHFIYSRFSKYPKVDRYLNVAKLKKLRDSIMVDIPVNRSTIRNNIEVLCSYDKELYLSIGKNRIDPYTNEPILNASALCYCWRKATNSDPSRQLAVKNIMNDHMNAIIFYSFDYELEALKSIDYGPNVEIAEYNGHKHDPLPNTKRWVYLVNYSSGSEAWNCITTNTIIFYSQTYSYKTLEQACGRIDRLNTPYIDLYYYHLVSKSKIDLAIKRALRSKKRFNEGKFAVFD